MAEDKVEPQVFTWRQMLPWTAIFQGFRVAMDINKLLLAAAGILVMAFGWWLLALVFFSGRPEPELGKYTARSENQEANFREFKADLEAWNVLHSAAGPADSTATIKSADVADSYAEYELIDRLVQNSALSDDEKKAVTPALQAKAALVKQGVKKPSGRLRTWPFFENRGPNPYLLATGQAGLAGRNVPWETGHFWEWFITLEVPVLLEPLVKLLLPVVYFFNPKADLLSRLYFLLVTATTLATWALFGGAITRIAVMQVGRREKVGLSDAIQFAIKRYSSYVSGPIFPIALALVLLVILILIGLPGLIPGVGELLSGLLWGFVLLLGLIMAIVLVGLVGWPLMAATISAEGTDSWEAVSRSYSYVFQAPWYYIWNWTVALVYGAVITFFVGFMGSFMVYLGNWGVSQTARTILPEREPAYLFVYAPTSYGWRTLLLEGSHGNLTVNGEVNKSEFDAYVSSMAWWNMIGAVLVTLWLYLLFLMILGFGYSYFWTASSIIYLLMRKSVDDAEMDEIYEEEEAEEPFRPTPPAPSEPPPAPAPTMVEPPALRVSSPPPAAPSTSPPPPAQPPSSSTPTSEGGAKASPEKAETGGDSDDKSSDS